MKDQTQLRRHLVAFVKQHIKGQATLFNQRLAKLDDLRGDSHQVRAQSPELGVNLTQSYQLRITIRSPFTPVKSDNQWSLCQ